MNKFLHGMIQRTYRGDNGNVLAGGDQFGDARVHRDSNGHTYTDPSTGSGQVVNNGNLVVDVLFGRSKSVAVNDATKSAWGIAA